MAAPWVMIGRRGAIQRSAALSDRIAARSHSQVETDRLAQLRAACHGCLRTDADCPLGKPGYCNFGDIPIYDLDCIATDDDMRHIDTQMERWLHRRSEHIEHGDHRAAVSCAFAHHGPQKQLEWPACGAPCLSCGPRLDPGASGRSGAHARRSSFTTRRRKVSASGEALRRYDSIFFARHAKWHRIGSGAQAAGAASPATRTCLAGPYRFHRDWTAIVARCVGSSRPERILITEIRSGAVGNGTIQLFTHGCAV